MGFERIIISALKEQEREAKRVARQQEQARNRILREQARYQATVQKQRYLISKKDEALQCTQELLESYKIYDSFIQNSPNAFSFQNLKKEYSTPTHISTYKKPLKRELNYDIKIPAESKLEKLFPSMKAKRINLETEKRKKERELENEYEKELEEYNSNIKKEKLEWLKSDKELKKSIEEYNAEIDDFEQKCFVLDESAVKNFIEYLLEKDDFHKKTIIGKAINYNKKLKKLIMNIQIDSKDNIFKYGSYKYCKQTDTIEPVIMKVSDSTQMLRNLLTNLCIGIFSQIFNNDIINSTDEIVVNIYHNRICSLSGKIQKNTFKNFDLSNPNDSLYFETQYLRVFKQLLTGVKPFEEIYSELV